jgi:hypothetical protein
MADSDKKSRPGALFNVTVALDVVKAGTPHQSKDIPADITPLESPDIDDSVAADASGESNIDSDSDSDRNARAAIRK